MEVTQIAKLTCECCGIAAEFQGQSLETIQKSGWLFPPIHGKKGEGQELCPNCATKEKPDGALAIAELGALETAGLKAQIEKLRSALESICCEVRNELQVGKVSTASMSDTLGRILSEARSMVS